MLLLDYCHLCLTFQDHPSLGSRLHPNLKPLEVCQIHHQANPSTGFHLVPPNLVHCHMESYERPLSQPPPHLLEWHLQRLQFQLVPRRWCANHDNLIVQYFHADYRIRGPVGTPLQLPHLGPAQALRR